MPNFHESMRRIITADGTDGQSVIIVDGGPCATFGEPDLGGLFEIWEDAVSGPLDPKDTKDLGNETVKLGPRPGNFQVRWFVVQPLPPDAPRETLNAVVRTTFEQVGAAEHLTDQTRHPAMHKTSTADVICLLAGKAKLILDGAETVLSPGQVVIQRGTSHAWEAIDEPALFLAVLIDRPLES